MMPDYEERDASFDPDEEFGWDCDNDWPFDGDWEEEDGDDE